MEKIIKFSGYTLCKLLCCKSCSFCQRVSTKERCKSQLLLSLSKNKVCERCFLCRSLEFCKSCHNCSNCCSRSTSKGQIAPVLGEMGSPRGQPQSGNSTQRRLHPLLPVPAKFDQVTNCYVNPHKNLYLLEALYQLLTKNAVEPIATPKSLGFYNRLFLVPKSNNWWRPILDLSTLNNFLNTKSFKMETPGTIRTSLQTGEWVTSIDFKDAYFHIIIHSQSRKYMRFHVQGWSYQFKALPCGLSTAPMEFTVIAKEVKLMALQRGIRIHQYLDDWLVRARSHHTCLQHTQTLVALSRVRLAGEQGEIRTGRKSGLQLRRLPVRPERGQGQTHTRALADQLPKARLCCPVRYALSGSPCP